MSTMGAPNGEGLLTSRWSTSPILFYDAHDYLGLAWSPRELHNIASECPFILGMHVWNCADLKTGQDTGRAAGMNFRAVFTGDRRPRMAAHLLHSRWAGT